MVRSTPVRATTIDQLGLRVGVQVAILPEGPMRNPDEVLRVVRRSPDLAYCAPFGRPFEVAKAPGGGRRLHLDCPFNAVSIFKFAVSVETR